jgi:S-adenosyl methyltransferase
MYDALLGGKDNYAADRQAARELEAAVPGAARAARDNRAFLGRAVHFLAAGAGIRQFIDIGTGLPTRGHVHQITRAAGPAARVVYADSDHYMSSCAHGARLVELPEANTGAEAPRASLSAPQSTGRKGHAGPRSRSVLGALLAPLAGSGRKCP